MKRLSKIKILLILGIILLTLVILFLTVVIKRSQVENNKSSKRTDLTPTSGYGGVFKSPTELISPTIQDLKDNKISSLIVKSSLSKKDMDLLVDIQKILPFTAEEGVVFYSPVTGKLVVVSKDEKSAQKLVFKLIDRAKREGIISDSFDPKESRVFSFVKEEEFNGKVEDYESKYEEEVGEIIARSSLQAKGEEVLNDVIKALSEFYNALYEYMITVYPSLVPTLAPKGELESKKKVPLPNIKVPGPIAKIFSEVETNVGVPRKILEAVLYIESPQYLFMDEKLLEEYANGRLIDQCLPNECSAVGPMQMTIGIDKKGSNLCSQCCWQGRCLDTRGGCPNQWGIYGRAINIYAAEKRVANPCRLRDNIYAAAAKLKNDSGARSLNWSKEEVFRAAQRYYGNCTVKYARLGNRSYCEFVWEYYYEKD